MRQALALLGLVCVELPVVFAFIRGSERERNRMVGLIFAAYSRPSVDQPPCERTDREPR